MDPTISKIDQPLLKYKPIFCLKFHNWLSKFVIVLILLQKGLYSVCWQLPTTLHTSSKCMGHLVSIWDMLDCELLGVPDRVTTAVRIKASRILGLACDLRSRFIKCDIYGLEHCKTPHIVKGQDAHLRGLTYQGRRSHVWIQLLIACCSHAPLSSKTYKYPSVHHNEVHIHSLPQTKFL